MRAFLLAGESDIFLAIAIFLFDCCNWRYNGKCFKEKT